MKLSFYVSDDAFLRFVLSGCVLDGDELLFRRGLAQANFIGAGGDVFSLHEMLKLVCAVLKSHLEFFLLFVQCSQFLAHFPDALVVFCTLPCSETDHAKANNKNHREFKYGNGVSCRAFPVLNCIESRAVESHRSLKEGTLKGEMEGSCLP